MHRMNAVFITAAIGRFPMVEIINFYHFGVLACKRRMLLCILSHKLFLMLQLAIHEVCSCKYFAPYTSNKSYSGDRPF